MKNREGGLAFAEGSVECFRIGVGKSLKIDRHGGIINGFARHIRVGTKTRRKCADCQELLIELCGVRTRRGIRDSCCCPIECLCTGRFGSLDGDKNAFARSSVIEQDDWFQAFPESDATAIEVDDLRQGTAGVCVELKVDL